MFVQKRLDYRAYNGYNEFDSDMRLVFSNCMLYNPPNSDVHIMAHTLLSVYESKAQEFFTQSAPTADGQVKLVPKKTRHGPRPKPSSLFDCSHLWLLLLLLCWMD